VSSLSLSTRKPDRINLDRVWSDAIRSVSHLPATHHLSLVAFVPETIRGRRRERGRNEKNCVSRRRITYYTTLVQSSYIIIIIVAAGKKMTEKV
jgi:hypothetical protein